MDTGSRRDTAHIAQVTECLRRVTKRRNCQPKFWSAQPPASDINQKVLYQPLLADTDFQAILEMDSYSIDATALRALIADQLCRAFNRFEPRADQTIRRDSVQHAQRSKRCLR